MSIGLFKGQLGGKYEDMYKQLHKNDKLMVDLYGLLVMNKSKEEPNFTIKQEVIFDNEMNRFMARYIVDVPLTLKNKNSQSD